MPALTWDFGSTDLQAAFLDLDLTLRTAACEAVVTLAETSPKEAASYADTIAGCLRSPDRGVRIAGCVALARLGEAARPHLCALTGCLAEDDLDVCKIVQLGLDQLRCTMSEDVALFSGLYSSEVTDETFTNLDESQRRRAARCLPDNLRAPVSETRDRTWDLLRQLGICLRREEQRLQDGLQKLTEEWVAAPSTVGNYVSCQVPAWQQWREAPAWAEFREVRVRVKQAFKSGDDEAVQLKSGQTGVVEDIDKEGGMLIHFQAHKEPRLVRKKDIDKLDFLEEANAAEASQAAEQLAQQPEELLQAGRQNAEEQAAFAAAVASLLADQSWIARKSACEVFGSIGLAAGPHFQALGGCLSDVDGKVRNAARQALKCQAEGRRGGSKAEIAEVIAGYLADKNWVAREAACRLLSDLGKAAAPHIAALVERLADSDAHVRVAACTALARLGKAAAPHLGAVAGCLEDACPLVRAAACDTLIKQGRAFQPHFEAVAKLLGEWDPDLRDIARLTLTKFAKALSDSKRREVAEKFLKYLSHEVAVTRQIACRLLGEMGKAGHKHLKTIAARLQDGDPFVRAAAAGALAELAITMEEESKVALASSVRSGNMSKDKWYCRQSALRVLADLGEASTPHIKAIADRMRDTDSDVQIAALHALSRQGEAALAYVPSMQACRRDPDKRVQLAAHATLLDLGQAGASSLQAMAALTCDTHERVRIAACKTLADQGRNAISQVDAMQPSTRDKSKFVQVLAHTALCRMSAPEDSSRHLKMLIKLLGDEEGRLRQAAYEALSRQALSSSEAERTALATTLGGSLADPRWGTRAGACRVLGDLGKAAAPYLRGLRDIRDDAQEYDWVRIAALKALMRLE